MQIPFKIQDEKQRKQQHQILLHFVCFLYIIKNAQCICPYKTVYPCSQACQPQKNFSSGRLPCIPPYQYEHKHNDGHNDNQKTTANIGNTVPKYADHHHVPCLDHHPAQRGSRIRIGGNQFDPHLTTRKIFGYIHKMFIASRSDSGHFFCLRLILINHFPIQKYTHMCICRRKIHGQARAFCRQQIQKNNRILRIVHPRKRQIYLLIIPCLHCSFHQFPDSAMLRLQSHAIQRHHAPLLIHVKFNLIRKHDRVFFRLILK